MIRIQDRELEKMIAEIVKRSSFADAEHYIENRIRDDFKKVKANRRLF
jgi:hypothetical protein